MTDSRVARKIYFIFTTTLGAGQFAGYNTGVTSQRFDAPLTHLDSTANIPRTRIDEIGEMVGVRMHEKDDATARVLLESARLQGFSMTGILHVAKQTMIRLATATKA